MPEAAYLNSLESLLDATWDFDEKFRAGSLENLDTASLVSMLDAVRDMVNTLKTTDEQIVEALVKKMGDPVSIGGAVAEVKWGKPRKQWETEKLGALVSEEILTRAIDPETGALEVPVSQLIQRLLNFVGVSYWKVTALKALGIDPDEFCEVGPAKASVVIRKSNKPSIPRSDGVE